jgi:hypothetical protein
MQQLNAILKNSQRAKKTPARLLALGEALPKPEYTLTVIVCQGQTRNKFVKPRCSIRWQLMISN